MAQTVIGFFDRESEAQEAVQQLVSRGINRSNIDVTANAQQGHESATTNTGEQQNGIQRFFSSLFGDDDDDATRYSSVASRSGSLVTVHAQTREEAEMAADILDDYGAVDVDERAAQTAYHSNQTDLAHTSDVQTSTPVTGSTEGQTSIPIVEENLHVGKRTVERGGVRVRSRIIERPVEEHVRLREEHVRVERNPIDRAATEQDLANFQQGDIEMIEHAEVPVVGKEARVVEEVRIGKDVEERDETIRDNVRKTEVDIENINRTEGTGRSTYND